MAAGRSVPPLSAMLAAEEDPASALIQHLLGLPHAQRQQATSIPLPELLEDVALLQGCPRCGFVPCILAALLPQAQPNASVENTQDAPFPGLTFSCANTRPSSPHHSNNLSGTQSTMNPTSHHCQSNGSTAWSSKVAGLGDAPRHRHQAHGVQSHHHAHSNNSSSTCAEPALQPYACPPLAAPSYSIMQLRPLLNTRKGVLSLMQFVWGQDQANASGADSEQQQQQMFPPHMPGPHSFCQNCSPDQDAASFSACHKKDRAANVHSNSIVRLSDSILLDDKLLARFMSEGLAHLQENDKAGVHGCVSHKGCPGPNELHTTETRLLEQKQGVLRQLESIASLQALPGESGRRSRTGQAREARDSTGPSRPEEDDQHDAFEEASAAAAAAERAAERVTHQVLAPSLSDPVLLQPPAPETSPRANRSCSRHPTSDPPQSAAAPPHHSSTPSLSSHLNQTLSSRALEHAATQHTILHRHARSQPVELSRRRGLTPLAQRAASREVGHLQADGSMAQNSGLQTKAEQLRDSLRQIEQRLKRLYRAQEHGLEAGGRRLLSLVLSRCWLSLIRHALAAQGPPLLQLLIQGSSAPCQGSWPGGAHTEIHVARCADVRRRRSSRTDQDHGMNAGLNLGLTGGHSEGMQGTADRTNGAGALGPDTSIKAPGSGQHNSRELAAASALARLLMHAGSLEAQREGPSRGDQHAWSPDIQQGPATPSEAAHAELQVVNHQLSLLSQQLAECQAARATMQLELTAALDQAEAAQGEADETTQHLRLCLSQWQGDTDTLKGMLPEELADLAGQMEAALSRVRAQQAQASAEQELLCPCCWERRKDLVFACGHQCCCLCGERLTACPICRAAIDRARSIRMFI